MSPSLRDQQRAAVREQLTDAAYSLVAEHGFDGATVDAIAALAGVGRTTAFRHFATKEDLLLGWLDDVGDRLDAELRARPGAAPLTAVREALAALTDVWLAHRDRTLAVAQLAADVASVRARYLERKERWRAIIAQDVAQRLQAGTEADLRPALLSHVALAASAAATEHWLAAGGTGDLTALVDEALEAVGRGLHAL